MSSQNLHGISMIIRISWEVNLTCVDNTSCLGSLCAIPDAPLSDFIGTTSEETSKVQCRSHGNNNLGKGTLYAELLALLFNLGIGHPGQAIFEADRKWDDDISRGIFINPSLDLWKMLVLLANVVTLRQIDQEDDWLCGQEEKAVDDFNLRY